MKNFLVAFLLLLSFYSCSNIKEYEGYPILEVSLEKKNISIMDLFDTFEIIPLETNDSCLLIWPDKILYKDGNYEIFDPKQPALFVFNEYGKFVRKVGEKGDGPEAYVDIYDVIHDEDNGNICMLSPFGEVFVYTSGGAFLRRVRLPQRSNYQSFDVLDDCLVTWTLPGEEEENGISFISKNTMLSIKEYWKGNRNLYFLYPRAFHKYENRLYFFRPFDREVYDVNKDSMKIAYRWDFGKDNYSIADFGLSEISSKGERESNLLFKYLEDSTIPYVISNQNQTNKYYYSQLVFGFTPQGQYNVFYRKDDGKSFFFKETIEGIEFNPFFFNDEFVICLVYNAELDNYKKLLDEVEVKKLVNRTEDDNPVLIKCYYK